MNYASPTVSQGKSAFLFFGGSSSVIGDGNLPSGIDLTNLPTTEDSTGWGLVGGSAAGTGNNDHAPRLVTMLVCDPQLSMAPATVTIYDDDSMYITRESTTGTAVGNMPSAQAMVITAQALLGSVSMTDQDIGVNGISSSLIADQLFMTSSTAGWVSGQAPIAPLSSEEISAKMNNFVASASKAYADGYVTTGSVSTMGVDADVTVQKLGLTGSRGLWVVTLVLVIGVLVLLIMAERYNTEERVPFDLENVLSVSKVPVAV